MSEFLGYNPNMPISDLINEVKSGVAHLVFLDAEERKIGSGSGFLSHNKLITCEHVLGQAYADDTRVWIRFENNSQRDLSEGVVLNINDLRGKSIYTSAESDNDFCILDVSSIDYENRYDFSIGHLDDSIEVGIEILFLGFPFRHSNLVSHRGFISSIYESNGINVLQLDASVNASNSGGPLIHPESKQVS